MDTTALIVWQSFLHSSPADLRRRLLECISPELISDLQDLATLQQNPIEDTEPIEDELLKVHFSWLTPFLRSLTENEIKLFLSALTLEQINGLKASLLLSDTIPLPSDSGKTYLKRVLFETIAPTDLLPISLLPQDPLNELLDLSRQQLDSLINLLSMHDLSIEVRHIIETSKLKEIYGLLTKAQETFLKTLLHKKEPVSFKKMGLLGWNGDLNALKSMLLQRGINRIAKSLYGKSSSLLWYLTHRLDSEKGQHLMKLCTALDHPKASALLTQQVIELMNALKTNNRK